MNVSKAGSEVISNTERQKVFPDWLPEKWQSIVDTIAELTEVPAGLVMRVAGDDIEVLVSSRTIGNPYKPGETMKLPDSGLYCEEVIRSRGMLAVANALTQDAWRDNPDIELGMISYLGVPIQWPDHHPFGTLCILDSKERNHPELYEKLLAQFRDIIEHHLSLIYATSQREIAVEADRTRSSEALHSSEERFKLLVEHAAEDFILHDGAGRILDANQQACRNSGHTKEALRGLNISDLAVQWSDAWNSSVWENIKPGETATLDTTYALANGQNASVEMRWTCQLMQGEKLFLVLIRDVSERKRAEEALRVAESELARASRLTIMGQLAGSIIHEVNQPLAALLARAGACLRWLDKDPPRVAQARESAKLLSDLAQDASDIVSGLRAIAQKSVTERVPVDLHDVIHETLLITRRECSKIGIERDIELCEGPLAVMGDPIQIKQVILNLLMNANDAMKEVTDHSRRLRVSTVRLATQVLVTFEDTGTGLKGDAAKHLFEPMFTTKTQGMGMGLAVCQSIMKAHGCGFRRSRPPIPI